MVSQLAKRLELSGNSNIINLMATRAIWSAALMVALLVVVACGGEAGQTITPGVTTPGPPATTIPATAAPPAEPTATIVPTPTPTTRPTATSTPSATLAPTPIPVVAESEFFLEVSNPGETEVITDQPSIDVVGTTRLDAVVTVNDALVEPDGDGRFAATVELEEGPNIIEVLASVASGEQESAVLVVIYIP